MSPSQKQELAAGRLSGQVSLLRCPVCREPLHVAGGKSLICQQKHTFDISKYGYVNFLRKPIETKYGNALFTSRAEVSRSGWFGPLTGRISAMLLETLPNQRKGLSLLDAGCGEGSHLAAIAEQISALSDQQVTGVGLDISKEGIALAAKRHSGLTWFVANLAESPLSDRSFDGVLNILSPSNYGEFHRVLTQGGLLVKVIPGPDYLRELRELLHPGSRKESSLEAETRHRLQNLFRLEESSRLTYRREVQPPLLEHLIAMTPLSWGADSEARRNAAKLDRLTVTVDLILLIGRKRS
ncbi:putative RNA methyltransferase [Paenibacillus faecis]|uniref:putative RNA methyltransferase n=1 Tax=Paenibacillus faecis TaxID=862114 RepID=UPI001BCC2C14|nr:methyltransferase domain-containing protein [Paenibacillus faecis]